MEQIEIPTTKSRLANANRAMFICASALNDEAAALKQIRAFVKSGRINTARRATRNLMLFGACFSGKLAMIKYVAALGDCNWSLGFVALCRNPFIAVSKCTWRAAHVVDERHACAKLLLSLGSAISDEALKYACYSANFHMVRFIFKRVAAKQCMDAKQQLMDSRALGELLCDSISAVRKVAPYVAEYQKNIINVDTMLNNRLSAIIRLAATHMSDSDIRCVFFNACFEHAFDIAAGILSIVHIDLECAYDAIVHDDNDTGNKAYTQAIARFFISRGVKKCDACKSRVSDCAVFR